MCNAMIWICGNSQPSYDEARFGAERSLETTMTRYAGKLGWSDVTPKPLWMNRRALMAGAGSLAVAAPSLLRAQTAPLSPYSTDAPMNTLEDITSYNNYYEFGFGKEDPKAYAQGLTVDPWSIVIDGLVDKPGTYDLADVMKGQTIEERIYRFRCVEAWSMVVPWQGFELAGLLNRVGVQSGAKYVYFETLVRPEEMPGQTPGSLEWPYREGLRLDEAMHPLTILATGLYGEDMPRQNGAPIRLVVPWKYGFKSIKAIVKISLVAEMPQTTWNMQAASEYGFYSNVNPTVDHPRWSQASERPLGGGLFGGRVDTLMFNGYEDQVASLYAGQDLAVDF
jgi:methionine sulfoxide reductase catalytic subunit